MALHVAILGSVEPRIDGEVVAVPAGKQRALLALLAVRAPHPVPAESAAEALWPRAAPGEAMRSLQVTVSRLRRSLGSAGPALETVASGYRLAVAAEAIDARRFETLVNAGQAARAGGDVAAARRLLDDALSLWRGPALAEVGTSRSRRRRSHGSRSCASPRSRNASTRVSRRASTRWSSPSSSS